MGFDRIDISEGIDLNQTKASKSVMFFISVFFLNKVFKYDPYLCSGCHDLKQKAMNFNDIAVVSINYWIHFVSNNCSIIEFIFGI